MCFHPGSRTTRKQGPCLRQRREDEGAGLTFSLPRGCGSACREGKASDPEKQGQRDVAVMESPGAVLKNRDAPPRGISGGIFEFRDSHFSKAPQMLLILGTEATADDSV